MLLDFFRVLPPASVQSWTMRQPMLVGQGTQEVVRLRFMELAENRINHLSVLVHQADVSDSGDKRSGHDTFVIVILLEKVSQLVRHDGEQVHTVLLALVAGPEKLGAVCGRRVDEPAPTSRVVVEPNGVARGESERRAAEVDDLNLDVVQTRGVHARGLPEGEGFAEKRLSIRRRDDFGAGVCRRGRGLQRRVALVASQGDVEV